MKRALALVTCACLALVACGSSDEGVKCSFKNPIAVDESADQWPKFRRDSQNTGTITLADDAYQLVASPDRPQREAGWVFPPTDDPARGPFVASASLNGASGDDRRVYIASTDGVVFALRAGDGARITTEGGDGILFNISPAAITCTPMVGTLDGQDAVVVGTGDARLFGVGGDGFILPQIWPFLSDSFVRSSPAMSVDGIILTGSIGTGMFGVCPNGVGRYGIVTGPTQSSPAVGHDPDDRLDGTFYTGANDRRIRAIRRDGVILWTFSMSAPIVASPVVQLSADGTETTAVYGADVAGLVAKVDDDGTPFADFGFVPGSIGRTESSPALTQHPSASLRLYLGSDDGNLYAVDATTGAVLWSYATGDFIRSSPAVVLNADAPSDPIVIVGSFDGTLYFVRDLGDEAMLVGTYSVPQDEGSPTIPRAIESSPAVDRDGTVIIGVDNGRVYAVR